MEHDEEGNMKMEVFFVYPCLMCVYVTCDYFLTLRKMMEVAFKTYLLLGRFRTLETEIVSK